MSKDPAFLFYPNDYIGGTMGMTFEEKGAYIELLMMQFNRGHMTSHMIGQTVGQLWDKIKNKFEIDDQGKYYNKRLEEEIIKRQAFVKSRYNNINGTNQYSKKEEKKGGHTRGHMTSHMENENVNENISKNKEEKPARKNFIKPTVEEIRAYCEERKNGINAQTFFDHYETRGWVPKGYTTLMKDWKAAVRTWEGRRSETSYVTQDLRHDSGPISYLKKPIKNDTI